MILQRILDFLAQHGQASSGQIARAVGADAGAVEAMLETLERHRRVRRWQVPACGSCQQRCASEATVYFSLAQDMPSQSVHLCDLSLDRGAAR